MDLEKSSTRSSPDPELRRESNEQAAQRSQELHPPRPLSAEVDKVTQILQACKDSDVAALTSLATSKGGLVEDDARKVACMDGSRPHPTRTVTLIQARYQGPSCLERARTRGTHSLIGKLFHSIATSIKYSLT